MLVYFRYPLTSQFDQIFEFRFCASYYREEIIYLVNQPKPFFNLLTWRIKWFQFSTLSILFLCWICTAACSRKFQKISSAESDVNTLLLHTEIRFRDNFLASNQNIETTTNICFVWFSSVRPKQKIMFTSLSLLLNLVSSCEARLRLLLQLYFEEQTK